MIPRTWEAIICHSSAIGSYIVDAFLYSVSLILSQITVTTATTVPPVTVVCSGPSPITMAVIMASIPVVLPASGQNDVVLPPWLIPRDTVWGSVGLTTMMQQQQTQSQMPSQAYVMYVMGPLQINFILQS